MYIVQIEYVKRNFYADIYSVTPNTTLKIPKQKVSFTSPNNLTVSIRCFDRFRFVHCSMKFIKHSIPAIRRNFKFNFRLFYFPSFLASGSRQQQQPVESRSISFVGCCCMRTIYTICRVSSSGCVSTACSNSIFPRFYYITNHRLPHK